MGFLQGKKALIIGLASNRSIAYGIAKSFKDQGAELALTYQNEKLAKRVNRMAEEFGTDITLPLDVSSDEQINQVFISLKEHWEHVDIIVHSVAFAPLAQISGDFVENISREGFLMAQDISAYSFPALAKAALPMLKPGSNMLCLSYYGAEKAVPNYNVMGVAKASLEANVRYMAQSLGPKGIRVNAISAGPIRTLAASGVDGFRKMLSYNEEVAPLRQNVTTEQVGNASAFMCSELASGITGEILHVDAGFNAVAMPSIDVSDED